MSEYDFKPLVGRCFVGMRAKYTDIEGLIYIPSTAKYPQKRIGICTAVTLWPDRKVWIWESGKRKKRNMFHMNEMYKGIVGKWVACSNARLIQGNLFDVRLESVECIVPEFCDADCLEVPRCMRCKSEGEGNILLGGDGYCPVCGYNEKGEHIRNKVITVSEDEAHRYAYAREKWLATLKNRPAEKGTIYSFGKQPFYRGVRKRR